MAPTVASTPVEFRAADEPFTELTTNKEGTGFGQTGVVTLPQHTYGVLTLGPPGRFHIQGSVESQTKPFDFIILLVEEFERYKHAEQFSYVKDATLLGTKKGTLSATLPQDEYRIVFDNTRMGEATPSSEIRIDFTWRITPPEAQPEGGNSSS